MLGIVVSLSWELKSLTRQTIPVGTWRAITDNTLVALSGIGAERAYAAGSAFGFAGSNGPAKLGLCGGAGRRPPPGMPAPSRTHYRNKR